MPSATAAALDATQSQTSTQTVIFTTIIITATTMLLILAGIYYSGYADDVLEAAAKKYYSAKAQAEATALANTGSEKVQGVLKGEFSTLGKRLIKLVHLRRKNATAFLSWSSLADQSCRFAQEESCHG
jgi:Na+/alanine symporter